MCCKNAYTREKSIFYLSVLKVDLILTLVILFQFEILNIFIIKFHELNLRSEIIKIS